MISDVLGWLVLILLVVALWLFGAAILIAARDE